MKNGASSVVPFQFGLVLKIFFLLFYVYDFIWYSYDIYMIISRIFYTHLDKL